MKFYESKAASAMTGPGIIDRTRGVYWPETEEEELAAIAQLDAAAAANADKVRGWEGELIDASEVKRRHGLSTRKLDHLYAARQVIGFPVEGGNRRYPNEQFFGGGPLPALDRLLEMIDHDVMCWNFLVFPWGRLNDRRPIELLKEGSIDEVIAAAERQWGDPWCGYL